MEEDKSKMITLPVEALNDNVIQFIEGVHDVLETVKDEVITNDFSRTITFEKHNGVDRELAEIRKSEDDGKFHVIIHTNYAQYLWGVCQYLLIQFDNLVQIPMMDRAGVNYLHLKANIDACHVSMNVFKRSRNIMYKLNQQEQWEEPNIVEPGNMAEDFGKANGMYCGAMAFVYTHELAHNYLGHPTYEPTREQSKQEELDTDDTAIDFLLNHVPEFSDFTYKAGIVAVMSAILMLDKDGVDGGEYHPNMDVRFDNAIKKLNLSTEDNLWGMACYAINSYLQAYQFLSNEEVIKNQEMVFNTYKDMYEYYIALLTNSRKAFFPKEEKRLWEI